MKASSTAASICIIIEDPDPPFVNSNQVKRVWVPSDLRGTVAQKGQSQSLHLGARLPPAITRGPDPVSGQTQTKVQGENVSKKQFQEEKPAQSQKSSMRRLFFRASRTQRSELLLPFTPRSQPSGRHHSQASFWSPVSWHVLLFTATTHDLAPSS